MSNRPIKFRAYDTKNKKWLTAVPSLEHLLDDEDECVSHHDIDPESAIYSYPHNLIGDTFDDRVIWQQFTGLKDSTGKEIYEGDIVSTVYEEYSRAEVFFCVETASWRLSSKKTALPLVTLRTQEGQYPKLTNVFEKVIGNIFETPELLV